ncbi:carboxymuconolactone decarboxylase family protein [Candidatus Manganitrophus noduliformans]|uniref:Carboxymuconolactone decarboxylase family protein n=1 Tax=Candidatus Manganitrophus noduliformans TaxID=2606439 RepID=A0A7X6DN39_9BACT|nr:carboxymuconolactone decarboxylase family protein [Candidatus Manganitrophus noduliformans]NKE70235.1 carboxymuconolactone decarboxylase family protein [Candidatus Manganitrophus noduliformans]
MMKTNQEKAESDTLFVEMRKLSPRVTGGIMRAREASYEDGKAPGKYKLLTALAISIAIRCEPCIRAYVKMAVERGTTQEELIEFLNVAMTMQGCPGEEWSIKAYAAYKEIAGGKAPSDNETSCCGH